MSRRSIIFDRDTWQEIFGSISKNKTRTIITVIGVLWGIFIYITLSGSAKGMDNGFDRAFENVAINSMFLWAQRTSLPYDGFKSGRSPQLKLKDAEYIKKRVPSVQFIAPRNTRGLFDGGEPPLVVRGSKTGNYTVYGDTPEYVNIFPLKIFDGGRYINPDDYKYERKICIIGERTQSELFEKEEEPIGSYINISGIYFQIVGIHKTSDEGGFASDSDIYIPLSTFRRLYNTGQDVDWFTIAAYDDANVVVVEKEVKQVLRRIHRVHPDDERAFGSFNLGEIWTRIIGFKDGLTLMSLIVGIATIIAGVIGIGNILLISVKERTKELGVRRAIGATPSEVRKQILLESVFLTLLAGIVGIILGALVLAGINAATVNLEDFPFTNPTVPPSYIIGALFTMISMGVLIGLIPAQRAVSIKPIDALREE